MTAPTFDYSMWSLCFPDLAANVPSAMADALYGTVLLLPLANRVANDANLVASQQSSILNLMLAHVASLFQAGASPLVGRVSSASEGSVSVTSDYPVASASEAFWTQTKYGALVWTLTGSYRTMQYIVGSQAYGGCGVGGFLGVPQVYPGNGGGLWGTPWG